MSIDRKTVPNFNHTDSVFMLGPFTALLVYRMCL